MPYPLSCTMCNDEGVGRQIFEGPVNLQVKPVRGANPYVMLIGQDPTLSSGMAKTVLTLGKDEIENPIRSWLLNEVLQPTGLQIRDIYATNIVKCTFPGNRTPSHIAHDLQTKTADVLGPFFAFCKRHLLSEIDMIHPKIILPIGQPVHQLLVEQLGLPVTRNFAHAFGQAYQVSIDGHDTIYLPCIHYKTWLKSVQSADPKRPFYQEKWPQFLSLLRNAASRSRPLVMNNRLVG